MLLQSVPDGGPLCCCEYENQLGERSHILACCCDCQALDDAVDRCITCKKVPDSTMHRFLTTVADRCRLPGLSGKGAVKVKLDIILPILSVPGCLVVATLGWWATVFVLMTMPVFFILFYQAWKRTGHNQTQFFYVWGVTSVVFTCLVFLIFVVSFRRVLLWEILLLVSSVGLMFNYLMKVRQKRGCIKSKVRRTKEKRSNVVPNGNVSHSEGSVKIPMNGLDTVTIDPVSAISSEIAEHNVKWVDSRPIKDGQLETDCKVCNQARPPRSGHCNICNTCIHVRDHHCVWVDCCIGARNHTSFLMAMLLFLFCGFYGSHLTMTSLCSPEMYFDWLLFPSDCRFLYVDFVSALCFVSVCYTLLATCLMLIGFLHQLILISQNLTSQELHQASRRGWTRFWVFAINNINNQGVIRNWLEFLLSDSRKASPAIPS